MVQKIAGEQQKFGKVGCGQTTEDHEAKPRRYIEGF